MDSIEAAWNKVAQDIGEDPGYVIAATHGKRAADNLSHFKPHIKEHEMDDEVTKFEESILFFADAHRLHGPGSKFRDQSSPTHRQTIDDVDHIWPVNSLAFHPLFNTFASAGSDGTVLI